MMPVTHRPITRFINSGNDRPFVVDMAKRKGRAGDHGKPSLNDVAFVAAEILGLLALTVGVTYIGRMADGAMGSSDEVTDTMRERILTEIKSGPPTHATLVIEGGVDAPPAAPPAASSEGSLAKASRYGDATPEPSGLRAGEVDDNELFGRYREFLARGTSRTAHVVDVSERHVIAVRNGDGVPVFDALVTVLADGREVGRLRTHTDGRAVLFPAAHGIGRDATITLSLSKGGARATASFDRSADAWNATLPGAQAAGGRVRLDLLFVLDSTGSMSDEVDQLKATIGEVARRVDALPERPSTRYGLVYYRDRGDEYEVRTGSEFTSEVGVFSEALSGVHADNGGDGPEDVNQALETAVERMGWVEQEEAVRIAVLVADAPPHMDYGQGYDYRDAMLSAAGKGIKIFPIASSGLDSEGEYIFRQLALFTQARFVFVTYGGSTPHHVEEQDYTVEYLDELVVRLIREELGRLPR